MSRLLASFGYAIQGVAYGWRSQPNLRIHSGITAFVIVLGIWLGLSWVEWAIVTLTIALVVHAELFNTAIEAMVDKTSPEIHPLAKIAKDCAAGAVLISALLAVVVGMLVFLPKIFNI